MKSHPFLTAPIIGSLRMPVAEAVRDAIDAHIEARLSDAEFQARLKRILKENREILDRLAR